MQNSQRVTQFIDYFLAELHECPARWYISFYVKNPRTNKLERKQLNVNRIKSISHRRKYAKTIVQEINVKLASDWNPILEQESVKSFSTVIDVLNTFISLKTKELRKDSIRSYKSYATCLTDYLTTNNNAKMLVISFTKQDALTFLNSIYLTKKLTECTYNNYKNFT